MPERVPESVQINPIVHQFLKPNRSHIPIPLILRRPLLHRRQLVPAHGARIVNLEPRNNAIRVISVLAGHHLDDGVHDKRVLTHWAEHRGVTVGRDSDFLQRLNRRPRRRVRSGVPGVGGGGQVVDEAVEVRAGEEEVIVGGSKRRGRGGGGMIEGAPRRERGGSRGSGVAVHIHLLEGVAVAVGAEEGVGGRGGGQADAHVARVAPVGRVVEEAGDHGGWGG